MPKTEITIPIDQCPFVKMNLVTQGTLNSRSYDTYQCETCQLKGRRYGVDPTITTTAPCTKKARVSINRIKMATSRNEGQFGLVNGQEYEVVDCPAEQRFRYRGSLWVLSPTRNVPVRLLTGEYTPVQSETQLGE